MEALRLQNPRVIYVAYGETDDFAHDGNYDRYIDAAFRTDLMLSKLWQWVQSTPSYRNRTTMIVTTDHGRGSTPDSWTDHDNVAAYDEQNNEAAPEGLRFSNEIWIAAIGPCIGPSGIIKGHWKQSQIAATALACLNIDSAQLMPNADDPIAELLN